MPLRLLARTSKHREKTGRLYDRRMCVGGQVQKSPVARHEIVSLPQAGCCQHEIILRIACHRERFHTLRHFNQDAPLLWSPLHCQNHVLRGQTVTASDPRPCKLSGASLRSACPLRMQTWNWPTTHACHTANAGPRGTIVEADMMMLRSRTWPEDGRSVGTSSEITGEVRGFSRAWRSSSSQASSWSSTSSDVRSGKELSPLIHALIKALEKPVGYG